MRLLIVFLTILLISTACTAPVQSTVAPADGSPSESDLPAPGSTFETSLLVTQWKSVPQGSILFPLDPMSGTALSEYPPISLGHSSFHVFSPDRRTLAVVSFPNENNYNGSLLLIDLSNWKTQRLKLGLIGWVTNIGFNPHGDLLALVQGEFSNKVTLIDIDKGVIAAETRVEPSITKMQFTRSGESLMLYGQTTHDRFTTSEMSTGAPQVLLLDAGDLSPRWSATLDSIRDGVYPKDESVTADDLYEIGNALYLSPGLVFAPKQDLLYVLAADSEHLKRVDFANLTVTTIEIQDQLGWFEQLLSLTAGVAHAKIADGTSKQVAISPDGQFLYAVGVKNVSSQDEYGNWRMEQTPLGLEIIQTRDGQRLEHFETEATELSLSPDGQYIYLRSWETSTPWTEVFDISSRQVAAHKAGVFAMPTFLMNGQFLLASTYSTSESSHHMSILEANDLDVISDWTGEEYIFWLPVP